MYFEGCAPARCGARDGLLDGSLKLINLKDGTHRLHDLTDDSCEEIDISRDYPEAVRRMLEQFPPKPDGS